MTNYKGYMGKVLFVDLTKKTYGEFPWTDEDRKRTVGGKIMAADILLNHIKPGMKAFDEDNWLVITTGPLTRCKSPSSTRFNISTVSPLTGIVTSSNCGGYFGRRLKKAGWDAMVITGKADELTWIEINEDEVTFHDVPEMKGMLTGEAQKHLPPHIGKLVIGPAGENKVSYACVFSGERTAGRGGVGAVFGDKNLKAVTARGLKEPEIYDQERLDKINEQWRNTLLKHPITGAQLRKLGTAGLVAPMQAHRILATKNFSEGRFDNFEKVSGEELREKHLIKHGGCYSCPMKCERRVNFNGKNVKGPELETLGLLGPNLLNDDIEKIIKWNYELDELGIDTISCAGSIAFAMELQEKGMWDCGLHFGETDNLSEVFELIAHREGIGDDLANGTRVMSEKFGGKEFAIHAKGMELAAYEPRGAVGHGLGYATANRGGCHLNAGYMVVLEGLGLNMDSYTPKGKAGLAVAFQNVMEAASAAGFCVFTSYAILPWFLVGKPTSLMTRAVQTVFKFSTPFTFIASRFPEILHLNIPLVQYPRVLNAATGMKYTIGDFLKNGAYGYNVERICNIILGQEVGPDADTLPKRLTDEEQVPGDKRTKVPLDKMKKSYYLIRGWKDGAPTPFTIKRLGIKLPECAKEVYPYGKG
ncbi:MAG: aldehyde ferredoxin oxidoreductase family protein [Acutalibacteraceae bacterium]